MRIGIFSRIFLLVVVGIVTMQAIAAPLGPKEQVWAAELAFAKSMADRDIKSFGEHVSAEAIFFSGDEVLRGKTAVVQGWASLFENAQPPFSWEPEQIEVLESGTLALSSGPVRNPEGKVIARFNSIWRLESPNQWRVIFDKGSPVCPSTK
jgi:ketosteroid isomerase-like protein